MSRAEYLASRRTVERRRPNEVSSQGSGTTTHGTQGLPTPGHQGFGDAPASLRVVGSTTLTGGVGLGSPSAETSSPVQDTPVPMWAMPIFNCFFGQLLAPEDDFVQTLRKIGVVVQAICSTFALLYGTYWTYLGLSGGGSEKGSAGAGTIVEGVMAIVIMFIMFGNWFLVRRLRHVSDQHITVFMWILFFPCAGCTFGIPQFGTRILMMWYSILVVISQSNHFLAQAGCSLLVQLVSCYNDAWGLEDHFFPLLIPGARVAGPGWEVFIELSGSVFVSFTVVVGVMLQARAHVKMMAEAQNSVRTAQQIVTRLRKYDTDGVQQILDGVSAGSHGAVNPDLMESFQQMNDNLEKYRPFLPNYLFQSDNSGSEGDDDDDDDEGDISVASRTLSHQGTISAPQTPTHRHRKLTLTSPSNKYRDEDDEGSIDLESSMGRSELMSIRNLKDGGHHSGSLIKTRAGIDYRGRICLALLDVGTSLFQIHSLGGSTPPQESSFRTGSESTDLLPLQPQGSQQQVNPAAKLQYLVNAIYKTANATHASVHSMVGDTAVLSWNATHRIAQAESKAAKFFAKMKQEAKSGGFDACGAVCSGVALCKAITTTTKQQALVTSCKWGPALQGIFQLACRHRALLCDISIATAAAVDVRSHAVDCLAFYENIVHPDEGGLEPLLATQPNQTRVDQLWENRRKHLSNLDRSVSPMVTPADPPIPNNSTQTSSPTTRRVETVVVEIDDLVQREDDEWMYQLQKQAKQEKPADYITPALYEVLQGNFGTACSLFQALEEQSTNIPGAPLVLKSRMVQRLREVSESQLAFTQPTK